MKKLFLAVMLCIAIVLGLGLIFGVFQKPSPVTTQHLKFDFFVDAKQGFNLDTDLLHFGVLAPGNSFTREIHISNNFSFPIEGHSIVASNISMGSWFNVSPDTFEIPAYTNKSLMVTLYVPTNVSYGYYQGELLFPLYKVK